MPARARRQSFECIVACRQYRQLRPLENGVLAFLGLDCEFVTTGERRYRLSGGGSTDASKPERKQHRRDVLKQQVSFGLLAQMGNPDWDMHREQYLDTDEYRREDGTVHSAASRCNVQQYITIIRARSFGLTAMTSDTDTSKLPCTTVVDQSTARNYPLNVRGDRLSNYGTSPGPLSDHLVIFLGSCKDSQHDHSETLRNIRGLTY